MQRPLINSFGVPTLVGCFSKHVLILIALAFLLPTANCLAADDRKPAVLVYVHGPETVDLPWLRALHQRYGFNVDYTGTIGQPEVPLTWGLVTNYNCIVVVDPTYGGNNRNGGVMMKQTFDVLERYLQAGGGVLLAPPIVMWDIDTVYRDWEASVGDHFGATFLRRQAIREKEPTRSVVADFFSSNYLYTTNVTPHPVTEGVRAVWYPSVRLNQVITAGDRSLPTSPLRVGPDWTVVLRGSDTAYTTAENVRLSNLDMPVMESTNTYASAPPLFAVRQYQAGRLGLYVMDRRYHFTAGTHRNVMGGGDDLTGGVVLERGLDSRPSDFGKLIANTLRWLAEPSLVGGSGVPAATGVGSPSDRGGDAAPTGVILGGYQQELTKLNEPDPGPSPVVDWPQKFPELVPSFRGLIGARTSLSDGRGSVSDYAKAARQAGLDYLVFLETFEKMTPAKLAELKKQCAAASDAKLLCIPGLYIQDNRGHHQFYFGVRDLLWPAPEYLTPDGKQLDVHAREDSSGLPQITFVLNNTESKNTIGYFALAGSPIARVWNLKLYAHLGLFYYRDGQQVDGLAENLPGYLEVNASGCNIRPVTIDRVGTPQALAAAVAQGHVLTWAKAAVLADVPNALCYSYLVWPSSFVSNGPEIVDWTSLNRDYATYSKNYVTPNYRFPVRLNVRSDAGLKEIKLYEGQRLSMRFLPNGAKEFQHTFEFNHNQQKHLILEVRDVNDRLAVSGEQFDRNHMYCDYWCSDRINAAIQHGPLYFSYVAGERGANFASKGLDQGNSYATPERLYNVPHPFRSSAGTFELGRFANRGMQTLVSEDSGVFDNRCSMYFPESEKLWSVWGTYGPLVEAELFDFYERLIQFRGHYVRSNPYNPTSFGITAPGDIAPALNVMTYRFKKDQVLQSVPLFGYYHGQKYAQLPNNQMILAISRDGHSLPIEACLYQPDGRVNAQWESLLNKTNQSFRIERGGFWAIYGTAAGAATVVQYNVGDTPILASIAGGGVWFEADVAGRAVKAGDALTIKLLAVDGEVPAHTGAWRYQRIGDYLGLDGQPDYPLQLTRGKQLPVTEGFCDVQAADGAIEFTMPRPKVKLQLVLAMRVSGLNDHWSAYCFDKTLNKARPIGVMDGIGYVRFDPEYTEMTSAQVGHPIIADKPGVAILFTQLSDTPPRYSLQINNPTDQPLTVFLKKAMDLPGLEFPSRTVELAPGQLLDVLPETTATR